MRLRFIQPHYTDSCYWNLVSWWKRFMWIIVNILAFTVGYYGDFAFRDRIPIRYRLFPRPCCMTLRKILNMLESASYFLSLNNRMDNWLFDSIRSETSHHCRVNCRFIIHRKRSIQGKASYLRKILNIFTKKSEHFLAGTYRGNWTQNLLSI